MVGKTNSLSPWRGLGYSSTQTAAPKTCSARNGSWMRFLVHLPFWASSDSTLTSNLFSKMLSLPLVDQINHLFIITCTYFSSLFSSINGSRYKVYEFYLSFLWIEPVLPKGELLGRINSLSNNSYSWVFSSFNSTRAMQYGCWAMGETHGKVSLDTSTSHSSGSPGSSLKNTSRNSFTTRIFFNCKPLLSEFKMYIRYPIYPFLRSF